MSVYTNALVHWKGTLDGLKTAFHPQFELYDNSVTLISGNLYQITHPECDIYELKEHFKRVSNHKKCVDIFHRECYVEEK